MATLNYSVIPIPLDVAGSRVFDGQWDYVLFQDARFSIDGNQDLTAALRIRLGRDGADFATWRLNSRSEGLVDQIEVEWDARPGVVASLYVSRGPNTLKLESPPPRQLVTSAVGTRVETGGISVGATPTLIVPADVGRQSVMIANESATVTMRVGGATVSMTGGNRGIAIPPGGVVTLDHSTAAIYGIVAAGLADAVYMAEYS